MVCPICISSMVVTNLPVITSLALSGTIVMKMKNKIEYKKVKDVSILQTKETTDNKFTIWNYEDRPRPDPTVEEVEESRKHIR